MHQKRAEPMGAMAGPLQAKKLYTSPQLTELGGLAALTQMDGIPHNGGAISSTPP